jgi:hypothetical protein
VQPCRRRMYMPAGRCLLSFALAPWWQHHRGALK